MIHSVSYITLICVSLFRIGFGLLFRNLRYVILKSP